MINQTMEQLGSSPSVIRELFAYGLTQAKIVGPENVFDYTLGNPSIPAPTKVNQAICDILTDTDSIAVHGYSMAGGFDTTRTAIADNLNRRFGTSVTAQNLFITCGAAPALISVIKALSAEPGQSEIMAVAPYFPEYRPFVENNGCKLVVIPADCQNFQIDLKEVEARLTIDTQAIIINSPNNPSGVVYTEETLKSLAEILTTKAQVYGHPIYIIADEPYRELTYGNVKAPFIPTIYDNTIVCYSWSKSLSLPGERIGYVLVPDSCENAKALYNGVAGAARAGGHVCAPTLLQKVIERCVDEMPDLQAYDENRILLYDSLTQMGYHCAKPDGAFYLFVKAPNGDGRAFSETAKMKYNLLVVPGEEFECPGYLRVSYCVSNDMIRRSLPAFQKLIDTLG
ncbi:MAG: pyridoxal phosphate-dependent aminotransferase [Firmicutes bacterium]|nr:pyridoxal phosphate-dependent aminotransferase [Bacillota bacterium]